MLDTTRIFYFYRSRLKAASPVGRYPVAQSLRAISLILPSRSKNKQTEKTNHPRLARG